MLSAAAGWRPNRYLFLATDKHRANICLELFYLTIDSLSFLFCNALATAKICRRRVNNNSGCVRFAIRLQWFTHFGSTTFWFCHFIQIFRASLCNRYVRSYDSCTPSTAVEDNNEQSNWMNAANMRASIIINLFESLESKIKTKINRRQWIRAAMSSKFIGNVWQWRRRQ